MTEHANDEMADDDLDIFDVENSIQSGRILKVEKDDPRGTRYTINGFAIDKDIPVATVGRFTATGKYRIITTYKI